MKVEGKMADIKFGVITKVPDESYDDGNMYDELVEPWRIRLDLLPKKQFLNLPTDAFCIRMRNFEIGEIMVLSDYGREISGKGRKPGKWNVTCEEFDDIQTGIRRSVEVTKAQSHAH